MKNKELVIQIAGATGIAQKDVCRVLESLADCVASKLASWESVQLHGIGTFHARHSLARTGRNPLTGAAIQIPAGIRIKLKAAKALKDAVAA